ncbi:MAG TPA: EVE domain-containing protein [Chthoniobacterales bacterium]|nr:EVE domain-containing protein [Chthoniobacterales bacterium]
MAYWLLKTEPSDFSFDDLVAKKNAVWDGVSNASALINLARNLGGSVGIAISSTFIAQRSQFHQSRLVEHVSAYDPQAQSVIQQLSATFSSHGGNGQEQALGSIYSMVLQQAGMLSYVEVFYLMAIGILLIVPLTFLLPKNNPQGKADPGAAAH